MKCPAICAGIVALLAVGGYVAITPRPFKVHAESGLTQVEKIGPVLPLVNILEVLLRPLIDVLAPMDVESLTQRAKGKAGLTDFGSNMEWDGLEIVLNSFNKNNHSVVGRLLTHSTIVNTMVTTLRFVNKLREHPEIEQEVVDRPVIITGMPRSGTTFTHHLLSYTFGDDVDVKYVKYWEAISDPLSDDEAARRFEASTIMRLAFSSAPNWPLVHEVQSIDMPEEETGWTNMVPPSTLHYLAGDPTGDTSLIKAAITRERAMRRFRQLKQLMQFHQWRDGRKYRWILKSPNYILNIAELADAFPDVKLIVNYREPVPVFTSMFPLSSAFAQMLGQRPPSLEWYHYYFCVQRNALVALNQVKKYPFQSSSPTARLDLDFSYLIKNPSKVVELVAGFADLKWDARAQSAVEKAIERHASQRPAKYHYDLSEWGVNQADLPRMIAECDKFSV